jgi:pimeloyl-ACP methyl ester carboxylesterase
MRPDPRIRRSADRSIVALPILLLILALPGVAESHADEPSGNLPAEDELAAIAGRYCARFMDGDDEGAAELASKQLRQALTPEVAQEVRAGAAAEHGALKSLGPAWFEGEVQGYRRYRVPATFERGVIDLRVVFDSEGRVAGFFHVPHVAPPGSAEAAAAAGSAEAGGNPAIEGHWEGEIEIPGSPITVVVDLSFADGAWSGTFGSPMQGTYELPLEGIAVADDAVSFTITGVPGDPTFDGRLENGEIRGTFTQMGRSFGFRLGHEAVPRPARPQEPQPPFPYAEEEVALSSGEVTLACTLTLPDGEGTHPAVFLITGSGGQNRDEEILGHKPFLLIADVLTRSGVAVLRCDDRGVGGSGGRLALASTELLAEDALAAVDWLGARAEIDAARVGLLGHSEGGIVAPLAATRSDKVAFVIMLAGTGVPGDQLLALQLELLLSAAGASAEQIEPALEAQRRLIDKLAAGAEDEELRVEFRKLAGAQLAATGAPVDEATVEQVAAQGVSELTTPWFRSFLAYDPRPALRELKVPVLAINGELDLQVDADQNLPAIRAALEASGNPDVTVKKLDGLNHLFQPAETGTIEEYAQIELTMDPAVLELIRGWIVERFVGGS